MNVHDSCWYSKDSKAWPGPIFSQNQRLHNTSMDRTYRESINTLFVFRYSFSKLEGPSSSDILLCLLLMILASYFPYLYWCLHSFAFLPCPFVWSHRVACCGYLVESQVCLQAQSDLWTTIRFQLGVSRNFEICYYFILFYHFIFCW